MQTELIVAGVFVIIAGVPVLYYRYWGTRKDVDAIVDKTVRDFHYADEVHVQRETFVEHYGEEAIDEQERTG